MKIGAARRGARTTSAPPAPRGALWGLGMLAAVRAAGLVLIAEAIARGIGGLAAGTLDEPASRVIVVMAMIGAILRAGGGWATTVVARRVAAAVKSRLRRQLWSAIGDGRAGERGSVAVLAGEGLDDLDDYYVQSLPAMISAAVIPLLVLLRIAGADLISAAVVIVTVPLVPLFMVLIGMHTRDRTDAAVAALARLADHLAELARGLPVLVGLGRVDDQARALDRIQQEYRTRTRETLRWAFLSALALELIATLSVAIVAVFLGLRLLAGTVDLTPALLALILAPECYAALREMGSAFHASQNGLAAAESARDVLERPRRPDPRRPGAQVQLHGFSVRYPDRHEPAVPPITGYLTGIVHVSGPSGAGKSTLLAALTGTLPADAIVAGEIVGVVPGQTAWAAQAPRFFAPTPWDELELTGLDRAGSDLALAELGLTGLGGAAVAELSPGEQRRLAIARALARSDQAGEQGAPLIALDEPTAHLDAASAQRVRDAIARRAGQATIVLATHDRETAALAGQTLTLRGADAGVRARAAASPTPLTREPESAPEAHPPTDALEPVRTASGTGLFALLRPQLWRWIGGILLAAVASGLGVALTALSGWLIVRASVEEFIMYLLVAIVGVRAFGIGRATGRYAERLATHSAALRTIDALRLRVWRALAERGASARRMLGGGAPLDYLVTSADDLRDHLPRVLPPLGVGVIALIGAAITTALVAPGLWLIPVALTATTLVASAITLIADHRAGRARVATRSGLVRGTAALAGAASDLAANDLTGRAIARLDALDDRSVAAERRTAWSDGLGVALLTLVTTALAAIAPVLAPALAPGLPTELVAVMALLTLALLDPLAGAASAAGRVPTVRALVGRLSAVLQPAPQPEWGTSQPPHPVRTVALDAVTVRYPGRDRPAVTGVDARLRAGQWTVLDGPSGSGKSTLLSAVMGALPVESGAVWVGGSPLTQLDEHAWKRRVAWCPQDAYVFDSTLRGNLMLARDRAGATPDAVLTDALTQVGLGGLLATLPDGLDTRVGAGGSALSGGQRGRLAVARALLAGADVVLLDEPTAHLDAPAADALIDDLRAATASRVVVLVSHRAADRRAGDAVVAL